jgi:hypothetical protein
MQLQEVFALFAANFVRWAAAWVQREVRHVPPTLRQALTEVKTLVRVLAHSRAQLVVSETGCGLVFDGDSPFAGACAGLPESQRHRRGFPLSYVTGGPGRARPSQKPTHRQVSVSELAGRTTYARGRPARHATRARCWSATPTIRQCR